ncbi:protein TORMOZ EMBRYO DEFECTIVE-like [Vicia villosa]|uniref:protein TORMOZ EMBRYO DEFECTIVE-like n=1 Tax=Vicia villosa TaxID=3911 RepID=UPI00273C56EE|nr:protein TORMOZ EMBRYO DEFECTIVE-like [Vicia villosa]
MAPSLCACSDSIKIVGSANASIRSTLEGDSEKFTALDLGPNDKLLFSSSHNRKIRVWDLSTLKCVCSWKVKSLEAKAKVILSVNIPLSAIEHELSAKKPIPPSSILKL